MYQNGNSPAIVLNRSEYVVSSSGETIEVEVNYNVDYEVVMPNVEWIKIVDTKSTHTHYYSIDPNTTYEQREAEITYVNKKNQLYQTVRVIQVQNDAIALLKESSNFSSSGGELEVDVQHNVDYEIIIEDSGAGWVSLRPSTKAMETDVLFFSIEQNSNYSDRKCDIYFQTTDRNIVQKHTVYQSQKDDIIIGKDSFMIFEGEDDISVEVAANVDYEVKCPSWIHYLPQTKALQNSTLNFHVEANPDYDDRSADIEISNGEITKCITVFQLQKSGIFAAQDMYYLTEDEHFISIDLQSNVEYEITTSEWIHLQPQTKGLESSTLNFVVEANPDYWGRYGFIHLTNGIASQGIQIVQEQTDKLIIHNPIEYIDKYGGGRGFTVDTNVDFSIIIPEIDQSWIQVSVVDGMARFTIQENTTPYERRSEILFVSADGKLRQTYTLVQAYDEAIFADEDTFEFTWEGGPLTVNVQYNADFEVETPDWIHLVPQTKSLRDSTLNFMIDPLSDKYKKSRQGTIILSNLHATKLIKVIQRGEEKLELNDSVLEFYYWGGDEYCMFDANVEFEILIPEKDKSWITIGTKGGNYVVFHVAENTTYDPRTSEILFRSLDGKLSQTLTVVQEQEFAVIVEQEELEFTSEGGMFDIEVKHNVDFEVSMPDWVHLQPQTKGLSTSTLVFVVDANPDYKARKGEIVISYVSNGFTPWGQHSINITQDQLDRLELSVSEVEVSCWGRTVSVDVESNVEYHVLISDSDQSWIQATKLGDKRWSIKVLENQSYGSRKSEIVFESLDGKLRQTFTIKQASN